MKKLLTKKNLAKAIILAAVVLSIYCLNIAWYLDLGLGTISYSQNAFTDEESNGYVEFVIIENYYPKITFPNATLVFQQLKKWRVELETMSVIHWNTGDEIRFFDFGFHTIDEYGYWKGIYLSASWEHSEVRLHYVTSMKLPDSFYWEWTWSQGWHLFEPRG